MQRDGTPPADFDPTWLCRTPIDRARMFELDERLGAAGNAIHAVFPLSCIFAAFWVGPWALLPLAAAVMFGVSGALMPRVRKPEFLLLAAMTTFVVTLSVAIANTGGASSPLVFWLVFFMVGVSSRFRPGVIAPLTVFGAAAIIGGVVAADPSAVEDALPTLVIVIAVGVLAGRYTAVMARTEFDHREAALIDTLTGLLNRSTLKDRFEELRQLAVQIDSPVSLVVLDLDHFKQVNDTHGHDCGDRVLRAVGYELRRNTRLFELIYRLGGEEFLMVLPGRDADEAADVAERVRRALIHARPAGIDITASLGVSCGNGEELELESLFHEADQALYEAKRRGRNTVVTAGDRGRVATAGAA